MRASITMRSGCQTFVLAESGLCKRLRGMSDCTFLAPKAVCAAPWNAVLAPKREFCGPARSGLRPRADLFQPALGRLRRLPDVCRQFDLPPGSLARPRKRSA